MKKEEDIQLWGKPKNIKQPNPLSKPNRDCLREAKQKEEQN